MSPKGAGHRRSIRFPGYDYGSAGAYFVTTCVDNRECLFGEIAAREMVLNDAGRMIQRVWEELPKFYASVGIDAFQIMPNHIHGIIILVGATPRGCPDPTEGQAQGPSTSGQAQGPSTSGQAQGPSTSGQAQGPSTSGQAQGPAPTDAASKRDIGPTRGPVQTGFPSNRDIGPTGKTTGVGMSLPDVVHRFKTMTTKKYADGVKQNHWPPFRAKLWQRNYYEHVVRDEREFLRIRKYILNNPAQWYLDRENPNLQTKRT